MKCCKQLKKNKIMERAENILGGLINCGGGLKPRASCFYAYDLHSANHGPPDGN